MSESVDILVQVEDKASKELIDVAKAQENFANSAKRAEGIVRSLQTPLEKYEAELRDLEAANAAGAISADKYAAAQARLADKIKSSGGAIQSSSTGFKEGAKNVKASTEAFGAIANLAGGSQLGSMASQLAGVTEKMSQFSEVSKAGGAGALAFKIGIGGVVAALAFSFGKAIGDAIFKTESWTRKLKEASDQATKLASAGIGKQDIEFGKEREEIELIRDPVAKQKAINDLLTRTETEVTNISKALRASKKAAEEWSDAWQITEERKALAAEAQRQMKEDESRLESAKKRLEVLRDTTSERTLANEKLKEENALAEKSESYVESLQQQLNLLKAKKEELIGIEAAKNTSGEADQREAERLLTEIDLLREKQAEEKRIADEKLRNSERIASLQKSELDRLELQRVELEKGKEAAQALALVKQGLDETTAKSIAREQAALDKLREEKNQKEDKPDIEKEKKLDAGGPLQATESRLLTRGSADQDPMKNIVNNTAQQLQIAKEQLKEIREQRKQNAAEWKSKKEQVEIVRVGW